MIFHYQLIRLLVMNMNENNIFVLSSFVLQFRNQKFWYDFFSSTFER
jgi:hypothetical protein